MKMSFSSFSLLVPILLALSLQADSSVAGNAQAGQRIDTLRGTLGALPWARTEVSTIVEMLGGTPYFDEDASEANFKANAGRYNILHLATHALVDDTNPMFSKFVFSDTEDSTEDGYLNTYELYSMDLNAELAVLSACNTGFGKVQRGEGISNLAKGFLHAGCPSVVVSLWQVADSKSTLSLMSDFYAELAAGKRKDAALRDAKLRYLDQASPVTADPFYWAGFVPVGNRQPLSGTTSHHLWLLVIGGAALIAIGVALQRKRRAGRQRPTG